jgi:Centromere-binding protein ParB C-terminal
MASRTAPEPEPELSGPAGGAPDTLSVDSALPAALPDPVVVDDSGLPPEVAAFLTATAVAAGVDPVTILRGTATRPRKRSRTSPDRVQRSFYLSRDLVDRARAAVSATMRRPGEAYNVSQLAGRALEKEVRRLELSYNNGQPFPPVSQVRSGPSPEGVERIRTGVTNPRRRRHA